VADADDRAVILAYHEATKHSPVSVRARAHHLDWGNRPLSLKVYTDLERIPLQQDIPSLAVPAMEAIGATSVLESTPGPDLPALARLLLLGAGVHHTKTYATAMSCTSATTPPPGPCTRSRSTWAAPTSPAFCRSRPRSTGRPVGPGSIDTGERRPTRREGPVEALDLTVRLWPVRAGDEVSSIDRRENGLEVSRQNIVLRLVGHYALDLDAQSIEGLNQTSAIRFVDYVLEKLPFQVEVFQTDHGAEFGSQFHYHVLDRGDRARLHQAEDPAAERQG
jgi:hypothetical protein